MGMVPTFVISAVDKTKKAFTSAMMGTRRLEKATSSMGGAMNRNRRVIQNAGFQISDFTVQVAGGQSAILAMTQQLPQFVQGFGAVGGVLAAVITIGGSVWLAMSRAGASLNELTPIAGVAAESLSALVDAFKRVGAVALDMANWVVNNLDQIIVTAVVVAGYFAGKWVASFIIARGVVGTLMFAVTSLGTVLGGLIKLSFLAAIGWLGTQFLKLKKATGSWTESVALLREVFDEAMRNSQLIVLVLGTAFEATTIQMEIVWYTMLQNMATGITGFINETVKGFGIIWFLMTNPRSSSNDLTSYMATQVDVIGDFSNAIGEANRNFTDTNASMDNLTTILAANSPKWQELIALIKAADAAGTDINVRDWFGGGGAGGAGGGGAGGAVDAIKSRFKDIKAVVEDLATSISTSVGSAFMSLVDGTKTASQAFGDMARSIIKKLFEVLVVQKMVANLAQLLGGNIGSGGGTLGKIGGSFGGGKAVGGPVTGGTTYLVGERGPELFTPSGSGSITPNGDLGGAGGVTVNQNVTIAAASDGDFDRMLSKRLPMLVETIKLAVVDARLRGGGFSTAMGT